MILYLRRRASFSAGFLNAPVGETGRGHDYKVELTVGGPIESRSGMVINIKAVDAVLQSKVVQVLQGRLLDTEVPVLEGRPPTPEHLVRFIWDACAPFFPSPSRLTRVFLSPNAVLWAELSTMGPRQEGLPPMLTVTRAYDFSASHRLHSAQMTDEENVEIFGKCNWPNGHGHNYQVEVTLTGEPDPETGLLAPPGALDALVEEEVLRPYDHRHLNRDAPEFRDLNPTSENLTRVIWDNLVRRQESLGTARLYRIVVRETERNYFEYYGD